MFSRPLNCNDLQKFIEVHHVDATILRLEDQTPTVRDAARVLEVLPDQIIKSLVFKTPSHPLLVITNGLKRVDRKKVAVHLGAGKNRVKLARPEQALAISGFQVGSMPPFGHRQPLRTLVDPAVAAQSLVYGGGGETDAMMRLRPGELICVTGADMVALSA